MSAPRQANEPEPNSNSGEKPGVRPGNGRRTLVLIFMIGFVPVLVAMISYFSGVGIPDARSNHGELLTPVQTLAEGSLRDTVTGKALPFGTDQPWRLMILPQNQCASEVCLEHLDLLRRMEVALARHADRVTRGLLVTTLDPAQQARIAQSVSGMVYVEETGSILGGLTLRDDSGLPSLVIVDPLGNLVLRYAGTQNPRDIIDDLKRMLKVSRIG